MKSKKLVCELPNKIPRKIGYGGGGDRGRAPQARAPREDRGGTCGGRTGAGALGKMGVLVCLCIFPGNRIQTKLSASVAFFQSKV